MPLIDPQELEDITSAIKRETRQQLSWTSCGKTHIGNVRALNEDAFIERSEKKFWAVADGMGGLSRGDYASNAIIEALDSFTPGTDLKSNIQQLDQLLQSVNEKCRSAFRGKIPGSTIALLYTFANACFFIWAGDSRIYRFRNGELKQITIDHTVLQQTLSQLEEQDHNEASGFDKEPEIDNDPTAHLLTRAVGVHKTLRLDALYQAAEPGDRYLICSDGLYNELSAERIRAELGQLAADDALNCLVDAALTKDGSDNITALIIDAN